MTTAAVATKLVSGTTASSTPVANKEGHLSAEHPSAEHPDLFFGRIHACLKAHELPKALEILRLGNSSIHRNLVPSNIEMVATFLSVEKETQEKTASVRCSRLTKVMEQHFPDVFQLEMIKKKGIEAGLSQDQVEQSLEQVVLADGSFWMIKEIHNAQYDAWERSLMKMAVNSKIHLWSEQSERSSQKEDEIAAVVVNNGSRGLFRGLENAQSQHWKNLIPFYIEMFGNQLVARKIFLSPYEFIGKVTQTKNNTYCVAYLQLFLRACYFAQDFYFPALERTSEKSKIPKMLMQAVRELSSPTQLKFQIAACRLVDETPNLIEWSEFAEAYLPHVFSDCSQEMQNALKELIAAGKKYKEVVERGEGESCDQSHDQALRESGIISASEKFLAAFLLVRDPIFANSFCSEWSNRNKDVISIVQFGFKHAEGFKREVIARQEGKAEKKEEKKKDNSEKADRKSDSK